MLKEEPRRPILSVDYVRLRELCVSHDVAPFFQTHLSQLLQCYQLCVIVDDSGSMRYTDPQTGETAWDETRRFVCTLYELCSACHTRHGCPPLDLWFLNRGRRQHIHEPSDVTASFDALPQGFTPLAQTLQRVLAEPFGQCGRIIIICSDGEECVKLSHLLEHERRLRDYVTFLAHCDNDSRRRQLDKMERRLYRFSVAHNYATESRSLESSTGADGPFSYADYVILAVMLAVVPRLRAYDWVKRPSPVSEKGHQCVIF